jgi:SlyX protein
MNEDKQSSLEQALIDLQTRLAFQEDTLQSLNDVVADHQREIGDIRRQVGALIDQLEQVLSDLDAGIENERPPHY